MIGILALVEVIGFILIVLLVINLRFVFPFKRGQGGIEVLEHAFPGEWL